MPSEGQPSRTPKSIFEKRCNEQTCYPPAILVLGRECKRPGDWALSKSTPVHIEKLKEERVERKKYILYKKVVVKPSSDTGTPVRFGKGDIVYYKAHQLSKAHRFSRRFCTKRVGTGDFSEAGRKRNFSY
ncbi:hypothetical protein QTP88_010739 [Uroleucon formosanum]